MNWTFDRDTMITDDTLAALDQARNEIATAEPKAATLLDKAERMVFAGHVMVVENAAWVYDTDGGWRTVGKTYCPHCPGSDLCAHRLAAWLARHLAQADPQADDPPAAFSIDGPSTSTGGSYLGGIGPGHSAGRRSGGSSGRRRSTCRDCNRCHWHRDGHCTNPNKKAGRGRR